MLSNSNCFFHIIIVVVREFFRFHDSNQSYSSNVMMMINLRFRRISDSLSTSHFAIENLEIRKKNLHKIEINSGKVNNFHIFFRIFQFCFLFVPEVDAFRTSFAFIAYCEHKYLLSLYREKIIFRSTRLSYHHNFFKN